MSITFRPVENYGTIQDFHIACEEGSAIELATFYGTKHNYGVWMLERVNLNDLGELPESTWIVVQLPHERKMNRSTRYDTDIFGMPVEQYSYGVSPFDAIKLAAMLVVAESRLTYGIATSPREVLAETLNTVKWTLKV